jgi:hypothetical protein
MKITRDFFERIAWHQTQLVDPAISSKVDVQLATARSRLAITVDGKTRTLVAGENRSDQFTGDLSFMSHKMPRWYDYLKARFSALLVLPEAKKWVGDEVDFDSAIQSMLHDAGTTIRLKRVSPAVKKAVTDWVWDMAMEHGRTRSEKAAIVSEAFGGSNSIGRAVPFPDDRYFGTFESAKRSLTRTIWALNAIRVPGFADGEKYDRDARISQAVEILRGFGLADELVMHHNRHSALVTVRALDLNMLEVRRNAHLLHYAMELLDRDEMAVDDLRDTTTQAGQAINQKVTDYRSQVSAWAVSGAINSLIGSISHGEASFLRFNQSVGTDEEMEAFIEYLFGRYVTKLKARASK